MNRVPALRPESRIQIEVGTPGEGYLARGSVTAGDDCHTFVGVYHSRQEAVADVTGVGAVIDRSKRV